MSEKFLSVLIVLAPLLFALTAAVSWFYPGVRPRPVKRLSKIAVFTSIISAALSGIFVAANGMIELQYLEMYGFGFGLRLDAISVVMFSMIAILALVIMRFSENYMDGDQRQGTFTGRLAATIASVQLLVLSGNLGLLLFSWVLTSVSLHRLLIFYADRPGARVAARKKFILARFGDACLVIASALLFLQFGSGNLELIFDGIRAQTGTTNALEGAAIFLVLAAVLKSAQFPTHGWLVEVMETPTPVSALLHAGLLNAGPFLIIRTAFIIDSSTLAPAMLLIVGGFTAVFASVVFLTQTSVKTALGYSSVAHMGFSLFACGLGVFPAAMLHLVAHSFYKAHAFLSSGSVIDVVRASKFIQPKRIGSPFRIFIGLTLAMTAYVVLAWMWGFDFSLDMGIVAIGAVISLGMAYMFVSALDANVGKGIVMVISVLSAVVASTFFALEEGSHLVFASQLPEKSASGLLIVLLTGFFLLLFALAAFVQILSPFIHANQKYQSLAVHVRNGFYANALFDRMVGAIDLKKGKLEFRISEPLEKEKQTTAKVLAQDRTEERLAIL